MWVGDAGTPHPRQISQLLASFLLFLLCIVSGLAIRKVQRWPTVCPRLSHQCGCGEVPRPLSGSKICLQISKLRAATLTVVDHDSKRIQMKISQEKRPLGHVQEGPIHSASSCPSQQVRTAFIPASNSGDVHRISRQGRSPEPRCPEFISGLGHKGLG